MNCAMDAVQKYIDATSRIELIKDLINRLILSLEEFSMSNRDVQVMCAVRDEDICVIENMDYKYNYKCIGSLIMAAYGMQEFCRIIDILHQHLSPDTLSFIMNYSGELQEHPIAVVMNITEAIDVIERYYGKNYSILYSVACDSIEYPTWAHFIISEDREFGVQQLMALIYNCDIDLLHNIWEKYFGDTGELCDVCYRPAQLPAGHNYFNCCDQCRSIVCVRCVKTVVFGICKCGKYIDE